MGHIPYLQQRCKIGLASTGMKAALVLSVSQYPCTTHCGAMIVVAKNVRAITIHFLKGKDVDIAMGHLLDEFWIAHLLDKRIANSKIQKYWQFLKSNSFPFYSFYSRMYPGLLDCFFSFCCFSNQKRRCQRMEKVEAFVIIDESISFSVREREKD